jgi:uncharacterized protein YbjT (DUF2867 family)
VSWSVGDLKTGDGIAAAVAGVDTVVHCATTLGSGDVAATRQLLERLRDRTDVHLVYVSIVGVDRVPLPYYRTKLEVERLIEASGVPWTVQRATQFHDLLYRLFAIQRWSPVTLVPSRTSFQPIDVRDVADRLAQLAVAEPAGRVADIGGPEVRAVGDLARSYLRSVRRRRPVVGVRVPGAVGAGYRAGGHMAPDHRFGTVTFEEYLGRLDS